MPGKLWGRVAILKSSFAKPKQDITETTTRIARAYHVQWQAEIALLGRPKSDYPDWDDLSADARAATIRVARAGLMALTEADLKMIATLGDQ